MTDEQQYICLNYCMTDPETGYCLTCGRPPLPPPTLDFSQKTFAGIKLSGKPAAKGSEGQPEIPSPEL